jgi:hypothetical protein
METDEGIRRTIGKAVVKRGGGFRQGIGRRRGVE